MTKKYFILEIKNGTHSKYGCIAFIYANPVIAHKFMGFTSRSVIDHYCSDTETFIIPEDMDIINSIIKEAQSNKGTWEVELSDFRDEITFNETLGRRIVAHLSNKF